MSEYVPAALRREVRQRANQCCEYCLIHEDDVLLPHEPDHIIAIKHRGDTAIENLAWTCFLCNRAKGSDIASVDGESATIVRLFSPRTDNWGEHFELLADGKIVGRTDVGRATASLLRFNREEQVEARQVLMDLGLYPPSGLHDSDGA